VRSYLVAGAVRLWQSGRSLTGLGELRFDTQAEAKDLCPAAHSMLFHPSASVLDQFTGAAEILEWAGLLEPGQEVH